MRARFDFHPAIPILSALLVLRAGILLAGSLSYSEDFTTRQYCDTLATTATWDIGAGELHLEPFAPTVIGGITMAGDALDVFLAGPRAYVAANDGGLAIVDISDPAMPAVLGSYSTGGNAKDVVVAAGVAYVACGGAGLQIIDVGDPVTPVLLGSYAPSSNNASGVAVAGGLAYLTCGSTTLEIVDVSDPASPQQVGTVDTIGNAGSVALHGDYAVVAAYSAGVQCIDISDPAAPFLAGSSGVLTSAEDVVVAGNRAYVACYSEGLQIIDLSDPTTPTVMGAGHPSAGHARALTVDGDRAYVASFEGGLEIFDITTPDLPSLSFSLPEVGTAYGVAVRRGHAFVACLAAGLKVVEVRGRQAAVHVGTYALSQSVFDIEVAGDHAFCLPYGSNDLNVLDVSDPAAPVPAGALTFGSSSGIHMSISGNHAFVGLYGGALATVDISDPTDPVQVNVASGLDFGSYPALDGRYIYSASGGVRVTDVGDPLAPVAVGSYAMAENIWDLAAEGGYVYVVGPDFGLRIIDARDPANPTPAGALSFGSGSDVYGVECDGDHVYLASTAPASIYYWLYVIDVGDKTNPVSVGVYEHVQAHYLEIPAVSLAGDVAYLHGEDLGPLAIDIADPTHPTLIGTMDIPGFVDAFTIHGDHAYLGVANEGIRTYEVSYDDLDRKSNVGQSLAVYTGEQVVCRVRLATTQTDGVTWDVSAGGGEAWTPVSADDTWSNVIIRIPTDLRWRSHHIPPARGVDPVCTSLTLDWRFEAAHIDSLVDVPNDQGGWVYLYFTRSGFDEQATSSVVAYTVYREIENVALSGRVLAEGMRSGAMVLSPPDASSVSQPLPPGVELIRHGGDEYLHRIAPEGGSRDALWAVVATVYANRSEQYAVLVPTLGDSGATPVQSRYYVGAHNNYGTTYNSPVDSCYSIDNIAPGVPSDVTAAYRPDGVSLDWGDAPEADFQYYRVYRSTAPTFVPGPASLVHETAASAWADPATDPWDYHYKITALDHAGNESEPGAPESLVGAPGEIAPVRTSLTGTAPNPFNPRTTIAFELSQDARVSLRIYDLSGRLVRALVDGEEIAAGSREAVWDGRSDAGRPMAAGAYFCRMEAGSFRGAIRMTLVK